MKFNDCAIPAGGAEPWDRPTRLERLGDFAGPLHPAVADLASGDAPASHPQHDLPVKAGCSSLRVPELASDRFEQSGWRQVQYVDGVDPADLVIEQKIGMRHRLESKARITKAPAIRKTDTREKRSFANFERERLQAVAQRHRS
ncbi:hypothetical protein HKX05_12845 [Sphingomonas sanguinis]|uniref:Uncharacterized protein n=1 Tax=Sphingomonas sanguinis TaxID=33051 RepID=A0ABX1UNB7_9SPHN|nr:hypothetical protein [Sphingomonas sanguinis]